MQLDYKEKLLARNYKDDEYYIMDLDDDSTQLFDDLITGRENEAFINGGVFSDSLRMAFVDAVMQCSPYRRLDSPALTKDCGPQVCTENLSNQSYDGAAMTLPLLDDFRLDDSDIASNLIGPSSHVGWRGRVTGKRAMADRGKAGKCKVCGDLATGMYFGALVCVPCKTFFLRYEGDNFNFVCKGNKDCDITMATRTQCKFCRYQKCREAGMVRRVRPAHVNLNEGQQLCVVCHDVANGIHFGAITCEGCKKFFRRGLSEHSQYSCKNGQLCVINPRTRNSCRYCRYKTCLSVGMSREAIQMGRPSKLAMESSGIHRGGTRSLNGNDKNHQLGTTATDGNEISPHYLMGGHHPKEEPPAWDWQMDQTVIGPSSHPDVAGFPGHHMTNVCDFLDSPAKHIGMEEYGPSHHQNGGIFVPLCSSTGGEQISNSPCMMSHVNGIAPEVVHYGNNRWNDANIDVSKLGTVQSVVLSTLYHNSGGSVHQVNLPSYEQPPTTGSLELNSDHGLSKFYHDKSNIPLTVEGITSDVLQFPPNSAADMNQSLKLVHLDPALHSKLEHFNHPRTALKVDQRNHKVGNFKNYSNVKDVLDSLLDNQCQDQEQLGVCSKPDRFNLKYDSGTTYLGATTSDQLKRTSLEANGVCSFENVRSTNDRSMRFPSNISSQQSDKMQRNGCYQNVNELPSSTTMSSQSQQGHIGYLRFDSSSSTEPSSTCRTITAQCTPPPQGPESNVSPVSTRSTRDDAVVPMMVMSDETKNNMDSIAEWVFQLQQSYVDSNEEDTATIFMSEDLLKVCRDQFIDGIPFEQQIERSVQYWKSQELPDENIMVGAEHWRLFNHFHPLYANYVSAGSTWNHNLRIKFEQWKDSKRDATINETMTWVTENVFASYTELSRGYFSQIQGFKSFDPHDQQILLRLAQSQSRVLAAALAWFDADSQSFTDFLPWRELKMGQIDLFKELLTDYAKNIQSRNLDPVESALFNIVVVIATDYPGLIRPDIIESYRTQFLATFRAYTTAKYGTPNKRMEKLFQLVPVLRRLGLLHYAMTQTPNIGIIAASTSR